MDHGIPVVAVVPAAFRRRGQIAVAIAVAIAVLFLTSVRFLARVRAADRRLLLLVRHRRDGTS
jgi:hypothetical protein